MLPLEGSKCLLRLPCSLRFTFNGGTASVSSFIEKFLQLSKSDVITSVSCLGVSWLNCFEPYFSISPQPLAQ